MSRRVRLERGEITTADALSGDDDGSLRGGADYAARSEQQSVCLPGGTYRYIYGGYATLTLILWYFGAANQLRKCSVSDESFIYRSITYYNLSTL